MTAAPGLARRLERLYRRYNHRVWIDTDPLGYVYGYRATRDREIVGLLASSLAFGRVVQIRRSLERLLGLLGSPVDAVEASGGSVLPRRLAGFRHRFVDSTDVVDLLRGIREVYRGWGSLNRYFVRECYTPGADMVECASRLAIGLGRARSTPSYLLPDPRRGSACKRLHLYLRWMTRRDEIDPGCWRGVRPADLVVPMDTHMHRICRQLGFVDRKQADGRAAMQATEGFRLLRPDDPVRYDFALTRIGMGGRLEELDG